MAKQNKADQSDRTLNFKTPPLSEIEKELLSVVKGFGIFNADTGVQFFCYTRDEVLCFLNKNKDWKHYSVKEGKWPSFLLFW